MKKLVMVYFTVGDYECGSATVVLCFEYESAEALIVHFSDALNKAREEKAFSFSFLGQEFSLYNFVCKGVATLPLIYELEEWFEAVMRCGGDCEFLDWRL